MARGGNNTPTFTDLPDEISERWHTQLTELASRTRNLLDPALLAPGVADPQAQAAAAAITALNPAVLRERLAGGLVIDLDDTLTTNVPLYDQSRWLLTPLYAEASGRDDLATIIDEREAICTRLLPEYGFTPERWRRACETYLDEIAPDASEDLRAQVVAAGEVALGVGEFYAGVDETLRALHAAGVPMLLLTKGEVAKQQEKIDAHGLSAYFDQIRIVSYKDAALLRESVEQAQLTDPVIIGDSAASDIAPAIDAGYDSVHVDRGRGVTWAAEQHDAAHTHEWKAGSFPEAILALLSSAG